MKYLSLNIQQKQSIDPSFSHNLNVTVQFRQIKTNEKRPTQNVETEFFSHLKATGILFKTVLVNLILTEHTEQKVKSLVNK